MYSQKTKRENREVQVSELQNELDRTIGFVANCDSKASVMLGVNGVIVTIFFSCAELGQVSDLFSEAFASVLTIGVVLSGLVCCYLVGLFKLVSSLRAKTDLSYLSHPSLEQDSKIFFGDIAANDSYREFREKYLVRSEEDVVNDYLSQIYKNSLICKEKYLRYNQGFCLSFIGLVGMCVCSVVLLLL